ncbi:MAG: response regulator transcription factor [Clostridiales bacterium]|nr:response regulator transcription factor [Clostridiales bacterium]
MKRILIVDDDIHISEALDDILVKAGYLVAHAYSGTEALYFLSSNKPDLILLDLMLPGMNGEEVLPRIKGIPVIIMSAKADVKNKVALLLGGAVDYVTKPFDTDELLARITVQLRKNSNSGKETILEFKDIKVDTDTHLVQIGKETVKLTRTEYAILKLLMQNPTQVITKSVLLDRISEDTPDCMENSLRVHISNLRKKLRDVSGKEYIEAVWGIGFKMTEA